MVLSKKSLLTLFIITTGFLAVIALVLPAEIASRINVFFAGLLVIITFLYTITTKDILDDSTIERRIDFISKQLEELYYPLWERMRKYEEVTFAGQLIENKDSDATFENVLGFNFNTKMDFSGIEGVDEFTEIVDFSDFMQKRYLFKFGSGTKEEFEEFVYGKHCTLTITSKDSYMLCKKLKSLLRKDIASLELNELTSTE